MRPSLRSAFLSVAPLLLALILIPVASASVRTTTIVVTNTNDNGPGSLRQALIDASDGNTIQFDPALNGQTITLTSGELVLDRNIAINGPGPALLTVSRLFIPKFRFRIFHVTPGHTVTIQGLTISGGATDPSAGFGGGGIYNEEATLNIANCSIQDNQANTAYGGGGILCNGLSASLTIANSTVRNNSSINGSGGGIHNYGGTLTVAQCTISDNTTSFTNHGGGIANFDGMMVINSSAITNNHASEGGGGIETSGTTSITDSEVTGNVAGENNGGFGIGGGINNGAALTIHRCNISGNTATSNANGAEGGGIFHGGASLIITESTINNNQAGTGGGIDGWGTITITASTLSGNHAGLAVFSGSGYGGAILCNPTATYSIQNSTLSGNSSLFDGGAILNYGHVTFTNSTITDNQAGRNGDGIYNQDNATVEMTNSIFKAPPSGANIFDNGGTITSHGYNISSDSGGGFFNAIGDLIDTNPMLGPLQNNGGPTLTHELLPNSPAINVGSPNFTPPPVYDQRGVGYDRVFGGRIDIGSFEVQVLLPTPTPSATPPGNGKIIFVSDRVSFSSEIFAMDADGANQTNLTNNPASDYDPAWSPDGRKIAFTSQRDNDNPEIYVMNADGSNQVRITNSPGWDRYAAWSPDGTKIAFASSRAGSILDIFVMNADGSNPIRLTNAPNENTQPAWSPNGAKIAFRSDRDAISREIYLMNADGSEQIRLTNNWDDDSNPQWSPDGTKIAFESSRDDFDGIYVMNANGSNQVRLSSPSTYDTEPAWSPDGQKIAFTSSRETSQNFEIYVMNSDGSNQIRLTNNPAFDTRADWGRVPSGTPVPTATATATATASPTPTATATGTPSPTPTATATSTASPTPVPSATPSPTPTPSPSPAELKNISTRLRVEAGDNTLIGGFIITGPIPRTLVVRGIGPSLAQFGVPDVLADPTLELRDNTGALIVANDNWQQDSEAGQLPILGLAPSDPAESAFLRTIAPGAYTAIVAGKDGGTGVGLVEVYNVTSPFPGPTSQLGNISTRGLVQTGENVMIGGFILGSSDNNAGIAIRGIGPSLTQFGIPNALTDPAIELHDGNGTLLISNDNWQEDSTSAAQLTAHGLAPLNPLESGIFISLQPGLYTAILAGKDGGTGIGLVEIYNVQ